MDDDPSKRGRGVKLPVEGKRNLLITSSLPYVNNAPHLGNIIGWDTIIYIYMGPMSMGRPPRPKPCKRIALLNKYATNTT